MLIVNLVLWKNIQRGIRQSNLLEEMRSFLIDTRPEQHRNEVDPRTVEMYRQGAKVQCRAVKVKHQAARRAIRLKQQRSAKWCVSSLKWMMWMKLT